MAWFGYVIQGLGVASSMAGDQQSAENIKASNFRSARALEKKADQKVAAGQREMLKERENKELVASRAVALAAAGGGSVDDPTVIDILADIESEGTYREMVAMYDAEQGAEAMREEAKGLREGIRMVESAASTRQTATALRGAASMYDMYSRQNPPKTQQGYG